MTSEDVLLAFFSRSFEKPLNDRMLDNDFVFSKQVVLDYIDSLCNIPFKEFFDYCASVGVNRDYSSFNITQISSFQDCTVNLCKLLSEEGDPGLSAAEMGRVLTAGDAKVRDLGALTKYGENHSKAAYQLGLVQVLFDTWYLSCYGKVFCDLEAEVQQHFMARALIRDPFYQTILFDRLQEDVNLMTYTSCLKFSTQLRRSPSVKWLMSICDKECGAEGITLHSIKYIKAADKPTLSEG